MQTLRCDILILGCGPAGLAAALAAASCGKEVVILDDNPRPGESDLARGPQVQLLPGTPLPGSRCCGEKYHLAERCPAYRPPSAHSVLFETADDSGLVEWQS